MKKCKTCGMPLWIPFILTYLSFTTPANKWEDIKDCIDTLGKRTLKRIKKEVEEEISA